MAIKVEYLRLLGDCDGGTEPGARLYSYGDIIKRY